jgi:hypothetical protein
MNYGKKRVFIVFLVLSFFLQFHETKSVNSSSFNANDYFTVKNGVVVVGVSLVGYGMYKLSFWLCDFIKIVKEEREHLKKKQLIHERINRTVDKYFGKRGLLLLEKLEEKKKTMSKKYTQKLTARYIASYLP